MQQPENGGDFFDLICTTRPKTTKTTKNDKNTINYILKILLRIENWSLHTRHSSRLVTFEPTNPPTTALNLEPRTLNVGLKKKIEVSNTALLNIVVAQAPPLDTHTSKFG